MITSSCGFSSVKSTLKIDCLAPDETMTFSGATSLS